MTSQLKHFKAQVLSKEQQKYIMGGSYYCTATGAIYADAASCVSNCSDMCLLKKGDASPEDPSAF